VGPRGGNPGYVLATISNISSPTGLAYDPENGYLYVADGSADNVSVLNASNGTLVATIPVGPEPFALAVDPTAGLVYVSNSFASNVSVINVSKNAVVRTVTVGESPADVQYYAPKNEILVASEYSNNTTLLNASTSASIGSIASGYSSWGLAIDPTAKLVYATQEQTGNLSIASLATNSVRTTVPVSSWVEGVAFDAATNEVFVVDSVGDNLTAFNATSFANLGNVPTGWVPGDVAVDPVDGLVYVTNQYSDNVSVIDPVSQTVVASIAVGSSPYPMAFDPANDELFVANTLSNNISVIAAGGGGATLEGVSVAPPSSTLAPGGIVALNATPSCTGGPCPSSVSYAWRLSAPLGSLNSTTGNPVVFTAGALAGNLTVTVNASLHGTTLSSPPVDVHISSGTVAPALTSAIITPGSAVLGVNATQLFEASALCTTGPCPAGVSFAWSLNRSVGALNTSTGSRVLYSAGTVPGNLSLDLEASFNGTRVAAAPADISVRPPPPPPPVRLLAVALSPPRLQVNEGQSTNVTAYPTCSGGPCPAGVTFTWSLNRTLGSLSASTGNRTEYTAPADLSGEVAVEVSARLGTQVENASSAATVVPASTTCCASSPAGSGSSSGPTWTTAILIAVGVGALAAVVVRLLSRPRVRPP
jgi:YVTN family beta-propeller protein